MLRAFRSSPSEFLNKSLVVLFLIPILLFRSLTTGGAYDDLTLWEQIDAGAQYTPSKKWLTSVPIFLYVAYRNETPDVLFSSFELDSRFLISTHYVKYNFLLFGINFAACVFVLFPKLPVVSVGSLRRRYGTLIISYTTAASPPVSLHTSGAGQFERRDSDDIPTAISAPRIDNRRIGK
jgi:hypothetical protein